ncbi:MAG: UDP-N-acetylmuramate:L-alanyl-gamma-D-glutamyl-meso-diaminopimelate ligase [Gammaproteobacteria bacterium]|nr:UDP-N-acetylmuramate:L-alanyl-gamma-D-glutamyl-meso-diaminopimelate ligase [Gammaproteobacteria bacterium]
MRIHILGIGGTFMAGIAIIAKEMGHQVTGSDTNLYDPMKTVLINNRISFSENYNSKTLDKKYDLVIVGNVMTRGMDIIEKLLDKKIPFTSGPQWLYDNVLSKKTVIAVSGTHGKTTTSSLVTHILRYTKKNPSYLIGGLPIGAKSPAKLTKSEYFVIEADEYDTAFFDKRSKYLHYRPDILLINNIEFDHADIFENINSIIKNFHHVIRTMPKSGKIIFNQDDKNVTKLMSMGIWSKAISFSSKSKMADWFLNQKNNKFTINSKRSSKEIKGNLMGEHNHKNISLAIIACLQTGVSMNNCLNAIKTFKGVKRRMEAVGYYRKRHIFDDFAHHPTEVESSIESLKKNFPKKKILAICEVKSNSMISGTHRENLSKSLQKAHKSIIVKSRLVKWAIKTKNHKINTLETYDKIKEYIDTHINQIDIILIMSNKSTVELRDIIKDA